jgi:hypothetical protein
MRKLPYVLAAAALSSLALSASPTSASPLASGLTNATVSEVHEDRVQKVHGWHCRKRYGSYRGHKWWHQHWRACQDYDPTIGFVDDDEDDDGRLKSKKHTKSKKHATSKKHTKHTKSKSKKHKKRKKSKKHKKK